MLDALERSDFEHLIALEFVCVHTRGEPGSSMEGMKQEILIERS